VITENSYRHTDCVRNAPISWKASHNTQN